MSETVESVVSETDASAIVRGEPLTELPDDLYIPPDALEVFLELFQGPLDLLLYLIRKQNLDILDIPIAQITHQYMQYVEVMKQLRLELAADYLVMSAALAEIKSRMLLPRMPTEDEEDDIDPRAELVRRLQEYERFKEAAEQIEAMPRMGRDSFEVHVTPPARQAPPPPRVAMEEIMRAFADVLKRAALTEAHDIQREALSLRQRMTQILDTLQTHQTVPFTALFTLSEGRQGVVVSFMAILELLKERLINITQSGIFQPLYVKAVDTSEPFESSHDPTITH